MKLTTRGILYSTMVTIFFFLQLKFSLLHSLAGDQVHNTGTPGVVLPHISLLYLAEGSAMAGIMFLILSHSTTTYSSGYQTSWLSFPA